MSDQKSAKRRYQKLTPAVWAEIEALWATGEPTLAELAHRYGVTTRALQARFSKRGLVKGAAASALAIAVKERVLGQALPDEDDLVRRARDVRETAYSSAVRLEAMLVACLDAATKDPSATFAAAAQVKMIGTAAQAIERLHGLKRVALGLTDDSHMNDDLPVLAIADLTEEEIVAMRSQDDDDADIHEEANEVVTVG